MANTAPASHHQGQDGCSKRQQSLGPIGPNPLLPRVGTIQSCVSGLRAKIGPYKQGSPMDYHCDPNYPPLPRMYYCAIGTTLSALAWLKD